MGYLRTKEYYDDVYSRYEKYQNSYVNSPYFNLWLKVIEKISEISDPSILEVGCGTGQFSHMLLHKGFTKYYGFDFSEVAIEYAQKNVTNVFAGDCYDQENYSHEHNLIVCLEVLEHLEDDMKILEIISTGIRVIFTVPDFDDPAHLRHFTTIEEVTERYSFCIDNYKCEKFDRWYIITGIKK